MTMSQIFWTPCEHRCGIIRVSEFTATVGDYCTRSEFKKFPIDKLVEAIQCFVSFANEVENEYLWEAKNDGSETYTPSQLLNDELPEELYGCPAIYVLHDTTNGRYYVGKALDVVARLKQHFQGNGGNRSIYASYKRGANFTIEPHIPPDEESLSKLEEDYANMYNAIIV